MFLVILCSADKSRLKRKLDLEFQLPDQDWCVTPIYSKVWPLLEGCIAVEHAFMRYVVRLLEIDYHLLLPSFSRSRCLGTSFIIIGIEKSLCCAGLGGVEGHHHDIRLKLWPLKNCKKKISFCTFLENLLYAIVRGVQNFEDVSFIINTGENSAFIGLG